MLPGANPVYSGLDAVQTGWLLYRAKATAEVYGILRRAEYNRAIFEAQQRQKAAIPSLPRRS